MELRCHTSCTGPGSKYYEKGGVYALPVSKYDVDEHPFLVHFDAPADAPEAPAKAKTKSVKAVDPLA